MGRARVLVDVDGVLADCVGEVVKHLNSGLVDAPYSVSDVRQWSIANALGVPKEEVDSIFERPGFVFGMKPYPEARAGMDELRKVADVYIVTSPHPTSMTWCWERMEWLKEHFDIGYDLVLQGKAKHIVDGDVLVDDKPANVTNWSVNRRGGLSVLWNQSWNEGDEAQRQLRKARHVRVRGWDPLLDLVRKVGSLRL